MMDFGQALAVVAVLALVVIVGGLLLIRWFAVASADWEADRFWRGRQREHSARLAEIDAMIAAGEPPLEILHKYPTTEEYGWAKQELAVRGYRLQHEPFIDADGFLVAEYVPMRELLGDLPQLARGRCR